MDFSLDSRQVAAFAKSNQMAMLLLQTATDDYAVARCTLLNGLFPGLVSAAQAVEKYLKAFILFLDSTKNVRRLSHSLKDLAAQVLTLQPELALSRYNLLIERLEKHYQTRYPDNPDASTQQSTGELEEIDDLIVFLNEAMPIPPEVKYRSGFYSAAFRSLDRGRQFPPEIWLKEDNKALATIQSRVEEEYRAVLRHFYPSI